MKPLFYFIFSLLLFISTSETCRAQINTTFTYADGYNACGESNLKITLKNISSDSIIPIIAEFQLNNAMQAISFGTSEPSSQTIVSVSGNTVLIVFKKALKSSSSFDINVKMNSSKPCNLIGCGQFFSTTDSLTLTHSNKDFYIYNNNILSSPCLTYDETRFTNRLTSAFLGDVVTRKIVLTNTGGGKFDGYLQFKDQFGEFVEIQSIYTTTPGATVISAGNINDSTYEFRGRFPNILNGDSIVIIEKVLVKKCIKQDEGKSSIYINWSCNPALCNEVNPYPIIAQIIKNKKKPEIVITKTLVPESNCLNSKTKYIYKIKNKGTRPATEVNFSMFSSDYNTYTHISKGSLVIKDTLGLNLVSTGFSQSTLPFNNRKILAFEHSCMIADPLWIWNFGFQSLAPGDSFLVESEGFHCCPGDDTSNVELKFEAWDLTVKYKDECKEEEFSANSASETQNTLSLLQFYEPIVTDMHEGDTATFEIFNNGFSTDFYRLNEYSTAFKIRIKLDTGLVYIPNSLQIKSIFGYSLTPTSTQTLTGAGTDGYIDTFLEALFVLPDTFRVNKSFFMRFMRNSSVLFDLKAICPAREPTSRFTQDFFAIPDLNCQQACEILLGSFTTPISVHCPGCVTPGWVAISHSAVRLNLGERDNDNNRLPDFPAYTPADRAKIKNNRCIPGDTLQTDFNAFFQDGDFLQGITTDSLENNATNAFHFRYSYLSSKITMGKLFNLNHAKVYIMDFDKQAITTGLDSIILPLSCITKIPNANDSLADAEFFFDLSLDTLYKYGIDPTYEYDPGDGIRVVCNYTILEPSSFYLSTPPTSRDPWLARENASILLNNFQNLVYLTGNRNTVNDRTRTDAGVSFEQDPTKTLDSTMIYWCEAYGSASTIVGKRREISFTIPDAIQCQDEATFYVAMNPSGGIFRNVFPFEYRNFITLDSIQATVPPGYKYSDWTITNTVQKPDGFLEYDPCTRTDTLKNLHIDGSLITIALDPLYFRQTDYGTSPCLDRLAYGDENIVTTFRYKIVPDCDLPETTVSYPSPVLYYRVGPNKIPYSDRPVKENCNPFPENEICRFFPLVTSFTKVNAELKMSPLTNESQLSKQFFCYPVSIEETKGNGAYFSFLKVKSLQNKVKAEKLTNTEPPYETYLADEHGVFHLDTIVGKTISNYELCFSNICGKLIEKDTVRLIFGHDCFEYPDSVYSNICKLDSIEHYVFPGTLQVGGFMFGPSEIKMCEPFEVSTIYNVTGIGGIDNMLLHLQKDSTVLLSATMSINDGTAVDVLSTLVDSIGIFNLKQKIVGVKADGLKAGDKIKMVLTFNSDCQYKGGPISERAIIVTSACDTLYGDVLVVPPPIMKGFPKPDDKKILSVSGELKNLGGQVVLDISAYNNAATTTENRTRITLLLPPGFTYANMAAGDAPTLTTDTSVIWDIAAGIPATTASAALKPKLNYTTAVCDTITFHYLLGDLSVGCSAQPCVQRDTTYLFKVPVKCYPCPADITLSERCKELPVFNVISWEYPTANYCPDDQNFIYKLYFSNTQNGTYTLLDSTHSKTYTHDSLEAYDGCYYVTVTDLQQGLTTQSQIACKATCREQFQCGDLFIPNLLTPNNDGNNDTFEITGAYTILKVEIYNSWGSTVFKSDNYKNEWDAKGLADGVYYFHIYIDGSDQKCLGWIHVLGGK